MLVIAVGNVFRGDDGVGPALAAKIRTLDLPQTAVVEALGDVGLIDAWTGHDRVVLLDAVHSGAAPGTVIRRDLLAGALPRDWFRLSSHQVGVADAVELARAMGTLPRRLVFIGVEGKSFDSGVGLTRRVAAALDGAAAMVVLEAEAEALSDASGPRRV